MFLGKVDMVQAILKGATLYPPAEIILFLYKLSSTQSLRDLWENSTLLKALQGLPMH